MAVTPASFVEAFPAFNAPATYTPQSIVFWLGLASRLLNADRWGDLLDYGMQLFVAHNLVLEAQSEREANSGNVPGSVQGPVTSGSVDTVSYSRDPSAAMDPANGHWNLTTYGLRYIRLVRMIGAGPVQVGVGGDMTNAPWPGVVFPNAW